MRAVQYTPGGPENLGIGSVPIPSLGHGEILLKVFASGINRADTLQRQGFYPPPPGESEILGLEASGIVEKVSEDVTKWKVGDRVMSLLGGGGNAEWVKVHQDMVMKIPDKLTFLEAAAIPETWLTAYQILHLVGELKGGETVLIHAGGSGVGIAAIQLAKLAGADVIVTAGTDEKIAAAKEHGATHGFNYKSGNFDEHVLKVTEGKGVNVILDCVGASFWEQNATAIAMDGRWVLYGLLGGGQITGDILAKILRKRIKLVGTTLRARSIEYKAHLINKFRDSVGNSFEEGKLKIVIDTVYPLGKISEAHKLMESNANTGKIILQVRPEEPQTDIHFDVQ